MTTNTDNPEQTELKMKLTITADELFALHPLPWTHHLLLIKDANGRQVIHTGGLYDQQGRPYSGPYLSGINSLLVEAVNARVSASSAAPAERELLEAFRVAAIKAHIGFEHESPWEVCPWGECKDRRKMLRRYAAASSVETGGFTCDCCGRNMEVRINGKLCNECAGYRAPAAPVVEKQITDRLNEDRCMFCGGKTAHEPDCDHGRPAASTASTLNYYEQALTVNWEATNARRLELITKKPNERTGDEANELRELQWLAGIKRELGSGPLPAFLDAPSSQPAIDAAAREIHRLCGKLAPDIPGDSTSYAPTVEQIAAIISRYFPEP